MFNCLILTQYTYTAVRCFLYYKLSSIKQYQCLSILILCDLCMQLPTSTSSDFANGSEIIADSGSLNNDASGDQEVSSELTGNSADEIAVSHFEADELAASFPAKETIDYQVKTREILHANTRDRVSTYRQHMAKSRNSNVLESNYIIKCSIFVILGRDSLIPPPELRRVQVCGRRKPKSEENNQHADNQNK